uniref:Death domain-containing protein n=1 Tax=Macrostomum lignano TaxID=282301 RepID=A0A1I8HNW7_9PLAT
KCRPGTESVGSLCCRPCSKGYGMITKCYRDEATGKFHDTECVPCSSGQMRTFSAAVSALYNCEKCRPCNRPSERLVSECTAERDTICPCADGYYRLRGGDCAPCASCPIGQGLADPASCNGTRVADCAPCPAGSFSAPLAGLRNRICRLCATACPPGYQLLPETCQRPSGPVCRSEASGLLANATELSPGAVTADSVFRDLQQQQQQPAEEGSFLRKQQKQPQSRPLSDWKELIDNGNPRPPINLARFNLTQVARTEEPVSRHSGSRNDMIPVYCAVLGAIIVSLIVWIVFKYFRSRTYSRKTQQHLPASNALIPPQSPMYPPPRSCQPAALLKRRSVDSGFGGSEALAASVSSSTRPLKEISDSRFQRLENILSNNPDPAAWKELATELGFSADEVQEFEAQADALRQSPIRLMLRTWSQRPGATIGLFGRCLQKAGRKDALILFKELAERQHQQQHQ